MLYIIISIYIINFQLIWKYLLYLCDNYLLHVFVDTLMIL